MKSLRTVWMIVLLAAGLLFPSVAQAQAVLPRVVMGPPSLEKGRGYRDLFEHPDQWARTRGLIDELILSDHELGPQNVTDAELKSWLALLKQWGLRLQLDTGAIKEWGVTGRGTFEKERANWDRVVRLGGTIDSIEMDEPLCCVRQILKPPHPDDFAVSETAQFIAAVRKNFPKTTVVEIETYPSLSLRDNEWWIDALQKKLAEMHVAGLDGYRLDVNWAVFTLANHGSWQDVARLQQFCHTRHLPFGLIYWAPGYPVMQHFNVADDSFWYIQLMEQGLDYAMTTRWAGAGPGPDQYVIEDWVGAPQQIVPETADFSFTRSVRDFVTTFVR